MAPPEVVSTKPFPLVPAVKERPILFSAPMVRALLDGTKTQTRRVAGLEVINADPDRYQYRGITSGPGEPHFAFHDRRSGAQVLVRCKHGQPGDRLWVREAWAPKAIDPECTAAAYRATDDECNGPWKPSIHMPRWASRIDLEVTGVRVERLQDISEADAKVEGALIESTVGGVHGASYVRGYRSLWDEINGADVPLLDAEGNKVGMQPNPARWDANPWVWVVEFRRIRP